MDVGGKLLELEVLEDHTFINGYVVKKGDICTIEGIYEDDYIGRKSLQIFDDTHKDGTKPIFGWKGIL